MSIELENLHQKQKERDPDLVGAEIAIKRAAAKVRQKAKQMGTSIVIWKDGRIVEEFQSS